MPVVHALIFAVLLLAAGACTQMRESEPGRTATEQLLFSAAAERAADALAVRIPKGSKVFVDPGYIEGTDSKYLLATLRDRILSRGGNLVAAREAADLVIEPRLGANSVDRKATLFGIPSFPVPIPLAGNLNFPELALFKRDRQQGVIKLALTSYDARTGALRQSLARVPSTSRLRVRKGGSGAPARIIPACRFYRFLPGASASPAVQHYPSPFRAALHALS
jgi:hypothetical protein